MSREDDRKYWVALSRFHPFGAVRLGRLSRRFPTMKRAFEASALDLTEAGIEPALASRFLQERMHIDPDALMRELAALEIDVMTLVDEAYPPLLKQIYDPPGVLYVRGTLPSPELRHLAVVGARKLTSYGERVCEELVEPLARSGVVIVSGLAYGVDSIAHATCLDTGGVTLGVLGTGIDPGSIYPARNRALASRILANGGALISEFAPGTPPLPKNFPYRNRIIAGLSHGTLVVEAAIKSGSLITARAALEQNRDVYVVPGSIHSPLSAGPNSLLKVGATPVTSAEDVFPDLPVRRGPRKPAFEPKTDLERAVYTALRAEPMHIDEIVRTTQLPAATVNSTMSLLEMKGAVKNETAGYFSRL